MDTNEFKSRMASLPCPTTDKKPPDWAYWRFDLWQRAQQDDPRNFTKWPCVFHTMLVDHWVGGRRTEKEFPSGGVLKAEFDHVIRHDNYRKTPPPLNPGPVHLDSAGLWSDEFNLYHQAYHILRWQEATGLNIADMQSIYEFGGGYGAMALVCNRLGFKGKYYIYDLPEFALLQQWYLEECGVGNVEWVKAIHGYSVDLFIACYSLSETTYREREWFLKSNPAQSYLFLYSNKFETYDNIDYFRNVAFRAGRNWKHNRIEHLPPESWYTWGW